MNNAALAEALGRLVPQAQVAQGKQSPELTVAPEHLVATLATLKDDPSLDFDFMFNLMGIDLDERLGVYYHLESYALGHQCVLKCFAQGRENPSLPTVMPLYPTAELLEREVFEMYGIHFDGHPDLRKFILPDDWQGYPMRKDYYDPVNIVER